MQRVTVLMPTYNVEPWVREAVESVLRQSFSDLELMVLDDCSTDNTLEVVRSFSDPRIRIVPGESNIGLADNLNRGLELAQTELLARMDGDDIAETDWLEKEIGVLDAHPEVGVCGGGFERFGTVKSVVRFPKDHDDIEANMLFECTTAVPVFRADVVRKHGLRYRKAAFPAEDYRFWTDMLEYSRFANVQETLFHYRMHPSQICSSRKAEQEQRVAEVRRLMLKRLSLDLTEEDVQYFTDTFCKKRCETKTDYKERNRFANYMVKKNIEGGKIDAAALRRRLKKHMTLGLHSTITEKYFANGYSPRVYAQYLHSGIALRTGWHYELRFLAKSLLLRNK